MDAQAIRRREAVKLAGQSSLAIAGTIIAATSFRAILNRIFAVETHGPWLAQAILLSLFAGLLWFALLLVFGGLCAIRTIGSINSRKGPRDLPFAASFAFALAVALMLATSAWLTLEANDRLFYSRLLPWIPSLIWFQEIGFRTASRLFPCRYEGFDTGCEAYKTLPAFLFSNALAYLPFSLASVFITRHLESVTPFRKMVASAFLRWGSLVGVALLCMRLVLFRLSPDVALPIAPAGVGRLAWLSLEWTAGPISVAFALSIPFVVYGAICAVLRRKYISERVVDLTRVTAFLLAAMILGNQYQ